MIGLIPHMLEDLIRTAAGPETLAEVRRQAGVPTERGYDLNGACPDEEWQRMLKSACEVLGLKEQEAEEAYAGYFCSDALKRWPRWFQMATNSREFLQRQPAIHNAFAMSLVDPKSRPTVSDKFRIETKENELITHYCSPNHHCGLYKNLARWIIDYYGDKASISETRCMKQGDQECEIHIRWEAE